MAGSLPGQDLVTAGAYPLLAGALRSRTDYQDAAWLKYHGLTADEITAIVAAVATALDGRCLTRQELAAAIVEATGVPHLGELLRSGWGALLKPAAYQGALVFGPSQGQAVTFVRPDQWLGPWPAIAPAVALPDLLRCYLHAYGPSRREDFARWWGSEPRVARTLFESLAGELTAVDVEGWRGWVLTSTLPALLAPPPAVGVRLLPHFDPYVVALYPQAAAILAPEHHGRVSRAAGWISPVVLVGGRIVGVWEQEKRRGRIEARIALFEPQAAAVRQGIAAEADRLGAFLDAPVDLSYS